MTLATLMAGQPVIHQRSVQLQTVPLGDDRIIVQGELIDNRRQRVFGTTGKMIEPGVVHHMVIRVLIRGNPIRIETAEAEMPTVPMPECRQTLDVIERVAGLEVRAGFSKRVKELIGGSQGCTHLCYLLTVMGPEIVHGWLTLNRKNPRPVPESLEDIPERHFLINSCRLWSENGAKIQELNDAIAAIHGS